MIRFKNIFKTETVENSLSQIRWQSAPDTIFENPKGIHIWKVKYSEIESQKYLASFSLKEHQKILGFRQAKDRNRRAISRGILKELSARYLNIAPKALNCRTNKFGKPLLSNHAPLQFNVSHSTDYLLLAFGFDQCSIGIDIEENNLFFNYLDIADQYFSGKEKVSLSCEKPSEQFFKIWTRKEAMAKAIGEGLNEMFLKVDVLNDCITVNHADNQSLFLKTFLLDQKNIFSIASLSDLDEIKSFIYLPA